MCLITVIAGIGPKQVMGCDARSKLTSRRCAEVTAEGGKTEVNAPDKSVLMDEFTSPTGREKRGSGRTPRRISVTRTERTSARVGEAGRRRGGRPVIGVKSILLFQKQRGRKT